MLEDNRLFDGLVDVDTRFRSIQNKLSEKEEVLVMRGEYSSAKGLREDEPMKEGDSARQ